MSADSTESRAEIRNGTVACNAFPLVIMTSNGEREFPQRSSAAASGSSCGNRKAKPSSALSSARTSAA